MLRHVSYMIFIMFIASTRT